MNFLRASPLRDCAVASALHFFIFSCCAVSVFLAVYGSEDRQDFMNSLRLSPASFSVFASALQSAIFCCCGVLAFDCVVVGAGWVAACP